MRLASQQRGLLVIVWFAFLLRGLFYCVEQPLWEGYDEWAHFAYVQHLATHGSLPERTDPVSAEVRQSLLLVPLSKAASSVGPAMTTHDAYWQLPARERESREDALSRLPGNTAAVEQQPDARHYEAQQPPLYYTIIAPVYLAASKLSLPAQVLTLRLISVLLVSLIVFLVYAIALRTTGDPTLALMSTIFLACLPGLYIDICRIGNEGLAIVVIAAAMLYALRAWHAESTTRDWLLLGVLTGAAMLAKAYALVLLPVIASVALLRIIIDRSTWRSSLIGSTVSVVMALGIAGWWYLRTWRITGTLSGEQLDAAANVAGFTDRLSAAFSLNWLTVIDAGAFTHIWMGGWSFLVVRKWMYMVCEIAALVAAAGLLIYAIRTIREKRRSEAVRELGPAAILLIACLTMAVALAYYSLALFLARNITTAIGWYFYAVIACEVVLLVVGLRGVFRHLWPAAAASVCMLAIALDLYTMHSLLMPYYSGMIAHSATGRLASFQVGELTGRFGEMMQRLTVNDPSGVTPGVFVAIWMAYLIATFSLGAVAVATARRRH